MARLFIEDKFFSSAELRIFTQIMKRKAKWPGLLSDGFMMRFWHDSQAKLTYRCNKSTLIKFISGYDETIDIEEKVFLALLESGFVLEGGDDTYIIKGNEENVSRLQTYRDKQKKSVTARSKLPSKLPSNCLANCKTRKRQMTYAYAYAYSVSTPSELTSVCESNEKKLTREQSDLKKNNARSVCAREAAAEIIKDDLTFLEEKSPPTEKKSRLKKKIDITKFSEAEIAAARRWAKITESETPWLADKIDYGEYADAIAKIKRHIKIGDEAMDYLIGFIERDQFWRRNAISPKSVFKKNTAGVYKIDNIVIAMKSTDTRFKQAAVLAQLQLEGYE